jgi:hypothetical protein
MVCDRAVRGAFSLGLAYSGRKNVKDEALTTGDIPTLGLTGKKSIDVTWGECTRSRRNCVGGRQRDRGLLVTSLAHAVEIPVFL